MPVSPLAAPVAPVAPAAPQPRNPDAWRAAQAFEAQFLAEMLKHTGLSAPPGTMGGGMAEAQMASMMTEQRAHHMVQAGGIGLAQPVYQAIMRARP